MTNIEKAEELFKKKEFSIRSCWECNSGHEHLKEVGGLFACFGCGRWYMNGDYFTNQKHCNAEFKEKTEEQKKWMEYLNQFIKESGYGQKGFFVELKTGEYLDLEEYNKWIVEMKDNYKNL